MKDSKENMIQLKQPLATATGSARPVTPAAGCFGYTQPNRKSAPCEVRDISVFTALFTKSI